jgi:hypothetical protein
MSENVEANGVKSIPLVAVFLLPKGLMRHRTGCRGRGKGSTGEKETKKEKRRMGKSCAMLPMVIQG